MPAGRPTSYRPEFVEQAREMCLNGATDVELADEFEVSVQTLYNWRAKFPEFLEAIKISKEQADLNVERTLYRKATGFMFNSEKVFCQDGVIVRTPVQEFIPPSDTAMIFWLKNRKPAEWRDKSEVDIPGLAQLAERLAKAQKRVEE